jgi:hypothetical protein
MKIIKKLLTNNYLVTSLGLIWVAISLAKSIYSAQWYWFSKAGSVMTICGVILTIRPIIRLGIKEWIKAQNEIDGGSFDSAPEDVEENRQSDLDGVASCIGAVLALLGAIIWGYGDLIGCFFD